MPRYDYQCQTCSHEFELRQSFSSEPVAACPECGNTSRRLIRAVPVVFKGSGFYVNDYGKGSNSGSSGQPSDSTKDTATSDNKKAESKSKPDNKAESSKKSEPRTKPESKKEKVSSS